MDILKDKWEESYQRYENFMFYPKEEAVKFLNRFVRKRIGIDKFKDILDFSKGVRGLDFGCGIGRLAILMREFGIDAYGVDISSRAIQMAKELAVYFGYKDMIEKFILIDGTGIPFEDNFFDVTISEGVLDSMYFELSKKVMKELDRVTKHLLFISLISGDDDKHYREFNEEEIVEAQHEKGTIQSYYNWEKIQRLFDNTNFSITWCHLNTEKSITSKYKYGRYHLVLSKTL